ncbi:MAG: flagellar FlbD family protein, partial [Planctomycetota bacterium]
IGIACVLGFQQRTGFLSSMSLRPARCRTNPIRFQRDAMIKLTRLSGDPFVLNADMIRFVEALPDTFVTLTTGERVVVSETMDQVIDAAVRYQQHKHMLPSLHSTSAAAPVEIPVRQNSLPTAN